MVTDVIQPSLGTECNLHQAPKRLKGQSRQKLKFPQKSRNQMTSGLEAIPNVGSRLVKGTSIMLNFSKIIQTPLFEKWYLYNANFFWP